MNIQEQPRIYIPTEREIAAIADYEPGDQLVEYYSAAERLRLGCLATNNAALQDRISGPMECADSETLSYLGMRVIDLLNDKYEKDWDGRDVVVRARNDARIMTQTGWDDATNRPYEDPYPRREYIAEGSLRFVGERFREFNNYHDPEKYIGQQLEDLKFYQNNSSVQTVFHVPVVQQYTGEPRVLISFT